MEIPETIRTPGYPLFLGLIYKIFGKSYKAVVLFQILLSILSIYFIYLIGNIVHNESTGLIMALAFSFDPVTISMNYKILSETLFLLFLILFILFGILWLRSPMSQSIPFISGVILALLTLIRPITYFLSPFIMIGIIVWYTTNNYSIRAWINQSILFMMPILIILGGWQYRNAIYAHNSSLSQIAGINMLYFRGASIIAEKENLTLEQARKNIIDDQIKNPWTYAGMHPEKNLNKKWEDEGISIMIKHPFYPKNDIRRYVLYSF